MKSVTLGIMKASNGYSVGLDGPDSDEAYTKLTTETPENRKAMEMSCLLHATWQAEVCAQDAQFLIYCQLRLVGYGRDEIKGYKP